MKVTKEILNKLEDCMLSVMASNHYDSLTAVERHYVNMGIGKDPVKRCRWDLVHASGQKGLNIILEAYESGCNDEHIDTALKNIMNRH
jgi:uncharacterized protein YbcI